jgi:hypothetical protein
MTETLGSLLAETAVPDIDPLALKLVPPGMGAIGLGFANGYLSVAWPKAPAPGDVAKVSAAAGVPVKPVALTQASFEVLDRKAQSVVVPESMDAPNVLDLALGLGASDVHLSAGLPPALRVGGDLRSVGQVPLSAPEVAKVAAVT